MRSEELGLAIRATDTLRRNVGVGLRVLRQDCGYG